MKKKSLLIRLEQEELNSIRKEADKLGISMTDFIKLLVKQWSDGIRFERKDGGQQASVQQGK